MIWNNCWIELHLLGLRIGREQCWSNQAIAVWFRSLRLVVETIPLKDSNNGLIIMLNCKSSNVKGDNKGGVQNILWQRLLQLSLQRKQWTSTTRGIATFQKIFFEICNTKTKEKIEPRFLVILISFCKIPVQLTWSPTNQLHAVALLQAHKYLKLLHTCKFVQLLHCHFFMKATLMLS